MKRGVHAFGSEDQRALASDVTEKTSFFQSQRKKKKEIYYYYYYYYS